MHKNNYEVNVLVNGKPVREYYHKDKFYIEARQNTEYSIKLKNHSHKKIMAVLSVDGIDVLKGKNAADAESGYIINPYSSTEIKGYRIDDDNIATFKFDDGKKSYSTQVEQKFDKKKLDKVDKSQIAPSKNNGIIGVRIWEEKEPMEIPAWEQKSNCNSKIYFYGNYNTKLKEFNIDKDSVIHMFSYSGGISRGIACSGYANGGSITGCANISYSTNLVQGEYIMPTDTRKRVLYSSNQLYTEPTPDMGLYTTSSTYIPNFELGTTWGKQEEDKIVKIDFIKADTYIDLEIYYLKRDELIKLGVDLDNNKKIFISGYPKAFQNKEDIYCKEPINWRKQ